MKMNKNQILKKLEELFYSKEVKEGFSSKESCMDWANKVGPLLKFNQQYYYMFLQYAHRVSLPVSSYTIEPALNIMKNQVQMAIEELKIEIEHDDAENYEEGTQEMYIDKSRLKELVDIANNEFDLSKLIQILNEINICYQKNCCYAVITLTRALIDHVPPIFGYKSFKEVASNYSAGKSFKESMQRLEESCRSIADQHLHYQIRKSETLPNKTQVNFSNDIDILLSEIVRKLKK